MPNYVLSYRQPYEFDDGKHHGKHWKKEHPEEMNEPATDKAER